MSKSLYILFALVIGATSVFAHSSYGNKLELALNGNGKPETLSLAYSYDSVWAWNLNMASALKQEQIANLPKTIDIKIMNLSTGKVYDTLAGVPREQLLFTNITIRDAQLLREILPIQKNLAITFSAPGGEYLYYYPLSEVCLNYPGFVSDLTKTNQPACMVSATDFAPVDVQCDEQKARLLDFIKQGYVTCAAAQDLYAKMGCGKLVCP